MNDPDAVHSRPRILVVEDQAAERAELMGILARENWTATCCATAAEGQRVFAEGPFDIVLLDICLDPHNGADRSGIALCREFRAARPDIGIYLLTNFPESVFPREVWSALPDDYLPKRIAPSFLLFRLRAFLERKRKARQGATASPTPAAQRVGTTELRTHVGNRPTWRDVKLDINDTEELVLLRLVQSPGELVTFGEIATAAKRDLATDVIPHLITDLRHAFRQIEPAFDHITSVRGMGYRWSD